MRNHPLNCQVENLENLILEKSQFLFYHFFNYLPLGLPSGIVHYKFIASSATEVYENSTVRRPRSTHQDSTTKEDVISQVIYPQEAREFSAADPTVNFYDIAICGGRQRQLFAV